MAWQARVIPSVLALGVLGCGGNILEAATDELGEGDSESETDDEIGGVETGTSSGDTSTTDPSTTDTSTTDPSTDDTSTTDPSTTDTSTTDDPSTTDTSTDDPSTTTDTVVDTACDQPVSFMIPAVDYASVYGWIEFMSTLGEGMVLSMPQDATEGVATFDIDIPCDDTWHIWVRGLDYQNYDSYWIRVEGEPQAWAIFELDCSGAPDTETYKWKQLNWRDANAGGCTYVLDPWTQDWGVGVHQLELGYRETWAISKIWVTNTNDAPP